MVPLRPAQLSAAEENRTGMALHDLHGPVHPAISLGHEGAKRIRGQSPPEALRNICGAVPRLEQLEAKLGIFRYAPCAPAAHPFERTTTHDSHCTMLDDRIVFVPLHHPDVEEPAVLFVAHGFKGTLSAVAIILWTLNQSDFRRRKKWHRATKPERFHLIIAVDHGDELRAGIRSLKRLVQRAGFVAAHALQMEKAKAGAERGAMLRHGPPHGVIQRVVVEQDDLELFVIETRQCIQRFDHHGGRLVVGGHMDGDERRLHWNGGGEGAGPPAPQGRPPPEGLPEEYGGWQAKERAP